VIGKGDVLNAVGVREVRLAISAHEGITHLTLTGLLHVPGLTNKFSGRLTSLGYTFTFSRYACSIIHPEGHVMAARRRVANMYQIDCSNNDAVSACACPAYSGCLKHQRLGHLAPASIAAMKTKGMVTGLERITRDDRDFCEACVQGKQHASSFPKSPTLKRVLAALELYHTDVVGPFRTASHAGHYYYVHFEDDYSRKIWRVPI